MKVCQTVNYIIFIIVRMPSTEYKTKHGMKTFSSCIHKKCRKISSSHSSVLYKALLQLEKLDYLQEAIFDFYFEQFIILKL